MRVSDPAPESALTVIKRKEIELQTRLLEARQAAERIVTSAREEAAKLRSDGLAAAEAEAAERRAAAMKEAREASERIRSAFEERAGALRGREHLIDGLAERIERAVAPRSS
jgi:vacuolar-type H+-ATPase subunit H